MRPREQVQETPLVSRRNVENRFTTKPTAETPTEVILAGKAQEVGILVTEATEAA